MKINCKSCISGNCNECKKKDCLCLESHSKKELENQFTEAAAKFLPDSPKKLKQILVDNPEKIMPENLELCWNMPYP